MSLPYLSHPLHRCFPLLSQYLLPSVLMPSPSSVSICTLTSLQNFSVLFALLSRQMHKAAQCTSTHIKLSSTSDSPHQPFEILSPCQSCPQIIFLPCIALAPASPPFPYLILDDSSISVLGARSYSLCRFSDLGQWPCLGLPSAPFVISAKCFSCGWCRIVASRCHACACN